MCSGVSRQELERLDLVRRWGDRWQYRTRVGGAWYTANSEAGAIGAATDTYMKTPENERLTPAERSALADDRRFVEWNARYGHLGWSEIMGLLARSSAVRSVSPEREFDGKGGRRTRAAVANEAARDAGEFRLLMGIYVRERAERAQSAGELVPADVLALLVRGEVAR